MVTMELNSNDLDVLEIKDIETLEKRMSHSQLALEFEGLADNLSNESPLVFDIFQAYDDE